MTTIGAFTEKGIEMSNFNVFVAIAVTSETKDTAEQAVRDVLTGDVYSGVIAAFTIEDVIAFDEEEMQC